VVIGLQKFLVNCVVPEFGFGEEVGANGGGFVLMFQVFLLFLYLGKVLLL
jgi:hypothetical protein